LIDRGIGGLWAAAICAESGGGGWGDCVSDGLIWVGSDDGFGDGKIVIGGN